MPLLNKKIKPYGASLCIVESTGGYERLAVERLQAAKLNVHVAHPLRVRTFAQAKGLLAKTDKLDAYVLSQAYGQFVGAEAVTKLTECRTAKITMQILQASCYTQVKKKCHIHAESCRLGKFVWLKQVKNNIKKI